MIHFKKLSVTRINPHENRNKTKKERIHTLESGRMSMQGHFFLLMQNMVLIGFSAEHSHVLAVNEAIPTDFLTQVLTSCFLTLLLALLNGVKDTYRNSHCDTVKR